MEYESKTIKKKTNLVQIVETIDCFHEDYEVLLKGDKILIIPRTGTEVKIEGKEYFIIDQKE